jgi:hypothetical protein
LSGALATAADAINNAARILQNCSYMRRKTVSIKQSHGNKVLIRDYFGINTRLTGSYFIVIYIGNLGVTTISLLRHGYPISLKTLMVSLFTSVVIMIPIMLLGFIGGSKHAKILGRQLADKENMSVDDYVDSDAYIQFGKKQLKRTDHIKWL